MSYGCGHYMARGDPGFFGAIGHLFGTAAKVVGGAALGYLTGGPVGGIKGAVTGTAAATASNLGSATLAAGDDPKGDAARIARIHAAHAAALAGGRARVGLPGGGMGGRRYRRMNWANVRALGRAERRIHAAVKHMTKYIRWVHPTKAGHAAPKFRRRKK
jgi:hypothetical protein